MSETSNGKSKVQERIKWFNRGSSAHSIGNWIEQLPMPLCQTSHTYTHTHIHTYLYRSISIFIDGRNSHMKLRLNTSISMKVNIFIWLFVHTNMSKGMSRQVLWVRALVNCCHDARCKHIDCVLLFCFQMIRSQLTFIIQSKKKIPAFVGEKEKYFWKTAAECWKINRECERNPLSPQSGRKLAVGIDFLSQTVAVPGRKYKFLTVIYLVLEGEICWFEKKQSFFVYLPDHRSASEALLL